jgi:hypothetical protein
VPLRTDLGSAAWRNHSTSGSSASYRSVAPARRFRRACARCFHGLCALHTAFSRTSSPPRRLPPKREEVDRLQRFCCVASVAGGATRGRRDAGHRAPRSVARRRRGPEGIGPRAGNPQRGNPDAQPPQQRAAARRPGVQSEHEVQDTTTRGATSQSEGPPGQRGEPLVGSHRRFIRPRPEAEGRNRRGRRA